VTDQAQLEALLHSELAELKRLSDYWIRQSLHNRGEGDDVAALAASTRGATYAHAHRRLGDIARKLDIALST
jgi:hypothetical protein